ncbi:MAG: hypothetical protein JWP97_6057 [Labilithrix sp.]|nr:hypothetical protein [Labilithrix sp.]
MKTLLLGSAALALAAFALAGCGHSEAHAALLRAPQGRNRGGVELYIVDQAGPVRPFYEVAIVQAIGFGADANPEDVAHALTEKAAALGCDAVVRTFIDIGYTRAHAAGVCVKYTGPAPEGAVSTPSTLPPDPGKSRPRPAVQPTPAPRIEPLPSSPNQGR